MLVAVGKGLKACSEFADGGLYRFYGAVAKWLRQRIANPPCPGSSPGGAYLYFLVVLNIVASV